MKKTVLITLVFLLFTANSFAQCWSQIAAGGYHTVAIKTDGTLWAWGLNDRGQLGDGTIINKNVPTQIGTDNDWVIVDSFTNNNLALKANGSLWAWGDNNFGQGGNGNYGNGVIQSTPIQVGTATDWVKLAAGNSCYAIKGDGSLWGWGDNNDGRLGTGDILPHYAPFQIGSDSDWTTVTAGGNQALAVKTNHTIWGWGLNKQGSLAIGPVSEGTFILTPTQTGNNTADWLDVETGYCCDTKMIKTDGSMWATGDNDSFGNIGNGGTADLNIPTAIAVNSSWSVVSTSAHTCAIKIDGSLWTWGNNFQGQLGDGTNINRNVPTQIGNTMFWASVVTGLNHTVALSAAGTLYTSGWNIYGQLGDGTFTEKNTPSQIGSNCILGTKIFNPKNTLKVFPNPVFGNLQIDLHSINSQLVSVAIRDLLGQKVYEKEESYLARQPIILNVSALSKGIYLLSIQYGNVLHTVKIIKQ